MSGFQKEIEKDKHIQYHIITDCRFPKEMEYKNSISIRIDRQSCKSDFKMENNLNDYKFNFYIDNNKDLDNFNEQIEKIVDKLLISEEDK